MFVNAISLDLDIRTCWNHTPSHPKDYERQKSILLSESDDTWRKSGLRVNTQEAFEVLDQVWRGKHDRLLKSVVGNLPDGAYKQRVSDQRVIALWSQVEVLLPLSDLGTYISECCFKLQQHNDNESVCNSFGHHNVIVIHSQSE